MARFSGKQYKGALQDLRRIRREEADAKFLAAHPEGTKPKKSSAKPTAPKKRRGKKREPVATVAPVVVTVDATPSDLVPVLPSNDPGDVTMADLAALREALNTRR